MKRKRTGTCAFCGKVTEITNDHIPPRNIFPYPQPNEVELITVPGCKDCNHGNTKNDEAFKLYITLKSGMEGEGPLKLHESTKRTVRKNMKIRNLLIDNSTPLFLPSKVPSIFTRQNIYRFNPEPIRKVGRKIIKGLFFKHFKECIEGKAEISLYLSEDFKMYQMITVEDLAKETGRHGSRHEVGNNREFRYVFAQTEAKYGTSWILVFNNLCAMIGLTIPKENIQQIGGEES